MAKRRLLALRASLACASLTLVGCGPGAARVATIAQPIINGTTDDGDPNVMLFIAEDRASGHAGACTASVVSPHVLLTAAHCIDPREFANDMGVAPTSLTYFTYPGNTFNLIDFDQSLLTPAQEVHFDPQFNPDPDVFSTVGHDVGIVILSDAATAAPIPLNHTALDSQLKGESLRVVGYGVTSGSDSTGATAGTKRQVDIPVSSVTDLFIDFDDGSHGICEGDSGGPALQTIYGVETIVGITAFGRAGCPVNKPQSETRVDLYTDYIDGYIEQFDGTIPSGADLAGTDAGQVEHHSSGGCSLTTRATPPTAFAWLVSLSALAFSLAHRRRGLKHVR
jgi:hypothetical protein